MALRRRDSCLVERFLTAWALCGRINTADVHPAGAASSSGSIITGSRKVAVGFVELQALILHPCPGSHLALGQ